MHSTRWKTAAATLIACACGFTAWKVASATPPQGFALVNIVGPAALDEFDTKTKSGGYEARLSTKSDSDLYVSTIAIQPGGHGGWHSHPGPSIIAVKSGVATFHDACLADGSKEYAAGTAFVEDADCVHLVENQGSAVLEIVVIQIVPSGAARRTDEAAPE